MNNINFKTIFLRQMVGYPHRIGLSLVISGRLGGAQKKRSRRFNHLRFSSQSFKFFSNSSNLPIFSKWGILGVRFTSNTELRSTPSPFTSLYSPRPFNKNSQNSSKNVQNKKRNFKN